MSAKGLLRRVAPLLVALVVAVASLPAAAGAAEGVNKAMYRLYNRYTGEHFYTASSEERDSLQLVGWSYEGIGWIAPATSKTPVYRLYNPYVDGGDHHYTTNVGEKNTLVKAGWRDEGIGWYSDDAKTVPLYRQYNPFASTGTHNYTANTTERDQLVSLGWRNEGVAWYGANGSQPGHQHSWAQTEVTEPMYDENAPIVERRTTYTCYCGEKFSSYDALAAHQSSFKQQWLDGKISADEFIGKHGGYSSSTQNVVVGTGWGQTGTVTYTAYQCSTCGAVMQ